MALNIPPARNYVQTLVALPCILEKDPSEGKMIVPVEIDWGAMGGPNNCVSFNLFGLAAQTISQIAAITIDNSACGADVQFIFPDTGQTYTVPAYSPADTFPVFTNQTNFFVSSPNALSSDTTRFGILNFCPYPSEIPITQLQNVAAVTGTALSSSTSSVTVVAAGTTGTIEGLNIFIATPGASIQYNIALALKDGTGKVLFNANTAAAAAATVNAPLAAITGMNLRFSNGIYLTQTGTSGSTGGTISVNLLYRTP